MASAAAAAQFGADGDYGQESVNAVLAFQSDHGPTIVDGIARPETLAGIALALRLQADADDYPPSLWISHVAVSDTRPLGPRPPTLGRASTVAPARLRAPGPPAGRGRAAPAPRSPWTTPPATSARRSNRSMTTRR
ncbi:peptidoglycan-binding domain-containing protein [Marinactinospora rubrisoli]|uniref:Peptidoglycan-binding protein n=1 Tax=Marinactinospora rubrisoli TaxID=2715399 RepID=A0ABW2KDY8_9ACTN